MSRLESEGVNKEVDAFLQSELVKDILEDNEIDSIRNNLKLPIVKSQGQGDADDDVIGDGGDPDVARLEKAELDSLLMPPPPAVMRQGLLPRPSLASLGITDSIEECMKVEPGTVTSQPPPTTLQLKCTSALLTPTYIHVVSSVMTILMSGLLAQSTRVLASEVRVES